MLFNAVVGIVAVGVVAVGVVVVIVILTVSLLLLSAVDNPYSQSKSYSYQNSY